ncbi:hypothetical protein H5407_07905 [Mitsuaria sp. WAJ17]|uniref:hypothetical protein n=1 Tax=Mitsuaria sp. WAJ17 TaxID=2761452 RepID=UPI0016031984|nr:hypothetical protein [Mitsuaria sp. WAJ17]MBB2485154.1 hypothetical protein [Mitsuaria sp. WAJ17]
MSSNYMGGNVGNSGSAQWSISPAMFGISKEEWDGLEKGAATYASALSEASKNYLEWVRGQADFASISAAEKYNKFVSELAPKLNQAASAA